MPDIKNDLIKNSQGIYKGGARSKDNALELGDVLVVKTFIKKKAAPTVEIPMSEFKSAAVEAPAKGKKWHWFLRTWMEQE